MTYCDNCGQETEEENRHVIESLEMPVHSANEGESAVLCNECGLHYQEIKPLVA